MKVPRVVVCGVAGVALVVASASLPQAVADETPKNIFYFIGDGMGLPSAVGRGLQPVEAKRPRSPIGHE